MMLIPLCLAACAQGGGPVTINQSRAQQYLSFNCADTPNIPKRPPLIHTPEADRAWGEALERAFNEARAARDDCAYKLRQIGEAIQ